MGPVKKGKDSERRLVEEALKLSESNLQALINTKDESIWSLDVNYNLIICNDYFKQSYLAAYGIELKLGLNLVELLSPELRESWKPKYDAALSGEKITFEFRETIQGNLYYFQVFLNPMFSEGRVTGVSALSIDITNRKRADFAVLESQKLVATERTLLRTIIDLLPAFVYVKDLENRFLLANVACAQYMGAGSPQELIGKSDADFYPEELSREFRQDEVDVLKGIPLLNKEEGSFFPVKNQRVLLTTKVPLIGTDQTIIGLVGTSLDITERKRAEIFQQIQFNIAREVVLAESLEKMVSSVRSELNRLIDTTNFFVALFIPESETLRKVVFVDEKDEFVEWKAAGSFSGQVVRLGKTILLHGQEIIEFAAENNLNLQGSLAECWLGVPLKIGYQVSGVMVVQSYSNPDAYNQASASLLEMIARELSLYIERRKMIDDLVIAKERAEESDRLKSAFLANMSHEIRTPLNSIIGFSELLIEEDNDFEEIIKYSSMIRTSGNRLLQLISNIIDISKIESGTEPIHQGKVSPAAAIREVVSEFRLMAERKSILIFENIPPELNGRLIRTDSLKLHQILSNLINNALKYTPSGFIEAGFEKHTGEIQFFVRDSGIGIHADELNRVFDRFYQVDVSYSRQYEGAGLGLSLCRGMVEMLGGRIWVESEVGKGSTFWFTVADMHQSEG